jgi:hypothetical protein
MEIKASDFTRVKVIISYPNGDEKIMQFDRPMNLEINSIDNSDIGIFDKPIHDFYVSGYLYDNHPDSRPRPAPSQDQEPTA